MRYLLLHKESLLEKMLPPDNAACISLDHQTGLCTFLTSVRHYNYGLMYLTLAKKAKAFNLAVTLTARWPTGPTLSDLIFPDQTPIGRIQ
jgi:hypothetical protein